MEPEVFLTEVVEKRNMRLLWSPDQHYLLILRTFEIAKEMCANVPKTLFYAQNLSINYFEQISINTISLNLGKIKII